MSEPVETGEEWPLEKLIAVLDKSVLLGGPIGFGPILPTHIHASDYFRALDKWGPITKSGMYPRLDHVWGRMAQLKRGLAREQKHARPRD